MQPLCKCLLPAISGVFVSYEVIIVVTLLFMILSFPAALKKIVLSSCSNQGSANHHLSIDFKQFFVKFANQNFPFVIIFVFNFSLHFEPNNSLISYFKKCSTVHYFLAFGYHFGQNLCQTWKRGAYSAPLYPSAVGATH